MASLEELRNERLEKIELLKQAGLEPYPLEAHAEVLIKDVIESFEELSRSEKKIWVAGRVTAVRGHGSLIFIDLFDGTGKIQGYLKEDSLGTDKIALFLNTVDVGDIIEVYGFCTLTKRGERSVLTEDWRMLTKSLQPLPEKWHGLKDDELRYRKRYLDLLLDDELRDLFYKKAQFWLEIRNFLQNHLFLEVQTPTLEITTGGAEARPFKTHHNDFDLDVFLRISVGELWQKRLMAAGFPRTFEIGTVYRNEGSSPEHLQEFTNVEFYASFMSFEEGKKLVKDLYCHLAKSVFGSTVFTTRGYTFDLGGEWKELDYVTTIEEMTGINILQASDEAIKDKLTQLKVSYEGDTRERLVDTLWKYCRKQIGGPAFLLNHPKLVAPLSKEHPGNSALTKTFQVILAGSEVGRAHAELNEPLEQTQRFRVQQDLLQSGDEEAMMPDWEYVEMLEHGMPPTFGFGFGERLFSFFADKTIRETQLFPLIKPKANKKDTY